MGFLNPVMLFGLAAISVPILIHFLNRRKFRRVVWGAMRFLRLSVEQNQKRMRIEDMILLALRCLLLALLALALARPALETGTSALLGQSKVTAVVILDNSYSMGMSDGDTTRFERSKVLAEQAIDSLPAGSATAVFFASDKVDPVIPEPTFDLNLARKVIREARLTDRATDLAPAFDQAFTLLRDRLGLQKEVFLFTDGQAEGWRGLTDVQNLLEQLRAEVRAHIVLVEDQEQRNAAVDGLRLASGLAPMDQPLRFEVKVTNHGRTSLSNARVALAVDAEPPSDEFNIPSLAPGETRSVSLFAKLRTEGFHSVTARVPEDRLPQDDQRTISVRALQRVRVLLVDGNPGEDDRGGEMYFVRNALVPVPPDAAESFFIKTTTVPPAELASVTLDDFDAVIFGNVAALADNVLTALQGYLRRGGGLIVFPGDQIDATFYNQQLLAKAHILPAAFGQAEGDAAAESLYATLQPSEYDHGIVSIWNDPGAGNLASARFYRSFRLVPDEPAAGEVTARGTTDSGDAGLPQIVLRFADGSPAVVERTWGLGRVVQFASTADTAWNDLPVRPSFLPLVHRVLGSVVQRQDEGLNVRVGERFSRRLSLEFLGKDAVFVPPRSQSELRELRRIEMAQESTQLTFDNTDFAGAYEVVVADPAMKLLFAAQADPRESSLDVLSPEQIKVLSSAANVVRAASGASLRSQLEENRSGFEFWVPVALAVLGLAVVESFLAQWFSRSK